MTLRPKRKNRQVLFYFVCRIKCRIKSSNSFSLDDVSKDAILLLLYLFLTIQTTTVRYYYNTIRPGRVSQSLAHTRTRTLSLSFSSWERWSDGSSTARTGWLAEAPFKSPCRPPRPPNPPNPWLLKMVSWQTCSRRRCRLRIPAHTRTQATINSRPTDDSLAIVFNFTILQ